MPKMQKGQRQPWNRPHPGTSRKRTLGQRERDLCTIARMYVRGHTQMEMIDAITKDQPYELTRGAITRDLKEVRRRWAQEYLADYNDLRIRELAHIDALESAYWDAWQRSMVDKEEVTTETIRDEYSRKDGGTPGYNRQRKLAKRVGQVGSKAFLEGIQWCIEQRCKILGLHATKKVQVDWRKQAAEAGIENPEDMVSELERQFVESANRQSPVDGGSGS